MKLLLIDICGARSPTMEKVELAILKFVLWKQEAQQQIPSREGIGELATFLINHTPIEMEVQSLSAIKEAWKRNVVPCQCDIGKAPSVF
jgi:hypothetical protein